MFSEPIPTSTYRHNRGPSVEDSEGVLIFDFEGGLDACPTTNPAPASGPPHLVQSDSASGPIANANAAATAIADPAVGSNPAVGRWSIRQTVCRHWLRSHCMKGDACGFLHQYDKSRMPVCRFFRLYGECLECTSTLMKTLRSVTCSSWVSVQIVPTVATGMQSCLDLLHLLKRSFRRFSI